MPKNNIINNPEAAKAIMWNVESTDKCSNQLTLDCLTANRASVGTSSTPSTPTTPTAPVAPSTAKVEEDDEEESSEDSSESEETESEDESDDKTAKTPAKTMEKTDIGPLLARSQQARDSGSGTSTRRSSKDEGYTSRLIFIVFYIIWATMTLVFTANIYNIKYMSEYMQHIQFMFG